MNEQGTLVEAGEHQAAVMDPRHEQTRVINLIERACTDPAYDVEKLERLMDMQERVESRIAKWNFDRAVSDFQGECPQIPKKRKISLGSGPPVPYASYDDMMLIIQPLLTKHGLSVSFDTVYRGEGVADYICKVSGYGHTEPRTLTLPWPSNMRVNDTQKMGAANSYGKRYALQNALNIVVTDEDTDAEGLDVEFITKNQAMALGELLDQLPEQRRADFMAWQGVKDICDIPASKYKQALAKLKKAVADAGH